MAEMTRWPTPSPSSSTTATPSCLEGFTHLIPYAAGHEIIRQERQRSDTSSG